MPFAHRVETQISRVMRCVVTETNRAKTDGYKYVLNMYGQAWSVNTPHHWQKAGRIRLKVLQLQNWSEKIKVFSKIKKSPVGVKTLTQ